MGSGLDRCCIWYSSRKRFQERVKFGDLGRIVSSHPCLIRRGYVLACCVWARQSWNHPEFQCLCLSVGRNNSNPNTDMNLAAHALTVLISMSKMCHPTNEIPRPQHCEPAGIVSGLRWVSAVPLHLPKPAEEKAKQTSRVWRSTQCAALTQT